MIRVNPRVNLSATVFPEYRQPLPVLQPVATVAPGTDRLVRAPQPYPVRFGKIPDIAGPIPPNSVVILVPGMFSPASSMQPLADYLKPKGHSVHILESPYNIKADSAVASTDWLTHNIDRIRLAEASTHYVTLRTKLASIPAEERLDYMRKALKLADNPLGQAAAKSVLGLMFTKSSNYTEDTDFTRIIQTLRKSREAQGGVLPHETTRKQLYSLTAIARKQLRQDLAPAFFKPANGADANAQNLAMEKTIDHVMDEMAPRVVLVGHSMGGFVSMLTLFEQMRDTSMVIGLAAPGENGTHAIPMALATLKRLPISLQQRGRQIVDWLGPAMKHMQEGSPETMKLKANHQPFNTTILAVGMPEDYDGLVGERNFKMNDALPGRLNAVVTPRPANMVALVSQNLNSLHQLILKAPPYSWVANLFGNSSDFFKGVAYHCGLLQYQNKYWQQDGDILRSIMEAPRNAEGKPDYQKGKPDYPAAVAQIRRAIDLNNAESSRMHMLNVLLDNLKDAKQEQSAEAYEQMLTGYRPLCPDLKSITQEIQPLEGGVSSQAKALLDILDERQPRFARRRLSNQSPEPKPSRSSSPFWMFPVIETSQMIARREKRNRASGQNPKTGE